ncbi:UNVERIFIED_CONTAM: hypothetical protein PYX00_001397 [Menopon gallinae]|uniref:Uncharacterized protein n=1 Tax=Menopon gallinae TaxID=328185 RepID=A0AAW2IC68_9NEOP
MRTLVNEGRHLKLGDSLPPKKDGCIRLYSMRFCPYAQRVHLVLDAKNIKYEVVNINLNDKPDWFFDKSPEGKVPAIELENGVTLYESLIIANYLDEQYPERPLYPKDPLAKAKDKLLMEKFNRVIRGIYNMMLQKGFSTEAMDDVKSGLDLFEQEIAMRKTKFLGGSRPGMLDFMIWPWCERADILKIVGGDLYKLPKDRFPKILEWRLNMIEDDAVRVSYLDPEIHAKYFLSRQAGTPDYDMLIK